MLYGIYQNLTGKKTQFDGKNTQVKIKIMNRKILWQN